MLPSPSTLGADAFRPRRTSVPHPALVASARAEDNQNRCRALEVHQHQPDSANDMRNTALLCGLLGLLSTACHTTIDQRVDPDAPDQVGGAALQSQDIKTMANKMARDIVASGALASAKPNAPITFFITELRNESNDPINKTIILNKLRTELFKDMGGRVTIVDRSAEGLDAVKREREAKRSGAVTQNEDMKGSVLGSDYVLKGVIQDRVQQSGSLKSAYYLVTFELTDLETSALRWTNDYEAKFLSEKSVITR
jgi:penicillin-binding protein activator